MAAKTDIVGEVIGHRLRQDDIARILDSLSRVDRDTLTGTVGELLTKTSALLEVSRQMNESRSLEELLPRMVTLVGELLRAERCSIFLHDTIHDELYSIVAQGEGVQEIRFPAGAGIAGSVFRSGESILIPDAYADERFNPAFDKKTGFRTRDILCVPIKENGGRAIGVTQALNRIGATFNEDDLSLLTSIADQTASAFVNAQLMDEIARARDEEQQLLEVTSALARELSLQPLLAKIMETVTTILNADRSTLFLHDTETEELWANVAQGLAAKEIRFPSHLGIAGSVFTSGQTINIPDAYADERFNQEVDRKTGYHTRSILCMPVINKSGVIIGVTQVLNKRGGPFRPIDEKRLAALSSQASIAIENAKLFETITRIKNYNESILESTPDGVLTVDPDGTIEKANSAALRLFDCEARPEALVGRSVTEAFGSEHNGWAHALLEKVAGTGESADALDMDLVLGDAGGEPITTSVNANCVPFKSTEGDLVGSLLIVEDITADKRLKGTIARYMTKEVMDKLLEEGEDALGGQTQTATVLFSDIRKFTSLSERLAPGEVVALLNEYFGLMVDAVLEAGGILDKYIGDAIMAVFGAPFSHPEDADNAVDSAAEMMRRLRAFNARRQAEGLQPIDIGIGLNTDEVLSGNIGSSKRMDYTVIGDGVNLAARLEGVTKAYGTRVLISELTVDVLEREHLLREVDRIQVKGKAQPVAIFEVLDYHDAESFPGLEQVLELWQRGLDAYHDKDWQGALEAFLGALEVNPDDAPSRMYAERCRAFQDTPPPEDWDGVWVMKTK